ncbi:hypothetical protein [Brevibacillus reuszeri]|uniref:hypothetical protein n=1 Tax=Brevibacillus reuszeri TaxID=54915 RepID=UPI000CCC5701|nr:hypothetical protein [Brevibacillus reuszeri]
MDTFEDLLKKLNQAKEIMEMDNNEIEEQIPFLIDLLDTYQNAHLEEAAETISNYLLSLQNLIIPHLDLLDKDSNFINYFCFYFLPKCSDKLIASMKDELLTVIRRNDFTEETDLMMAESLLKRYLIVDEIKGILNEKMTYVQEIMKDGKRNRLLLGDYFEHLKRI